ncbi:MAG: hypothetical protein J0I47_02100 [Sphingomonas sp.]|uniref:hypothetical protein n=1 Tax=Sphingomonas sp. TaxID=28214 RepID=UPI001AC80B25|nr:hypothetical protein [Sphingomonas sp.]MBN8807021.1 hypothetical protein [Sphingomonas sp.]
MTAIADMVAALLDAKLPLERAQRDWDLVISAYNESARVQKVFEKLTARRNAWWVIPEYGYRPDEISHLSNAHLLDAGTEAEVVIQGMEACGYDPETDRRLCVDITGLMRPQILYLMAWLRSKGVREYDLLYTEPEQYARKADTRFSMGEDVQVRSVSGYIGAHDNDMSGDILILGVGYDHHLISHVLRVKESARPVQLHSFPSLSADMYHESLLRLDRIWSERPRAAGDDFYTSANDPYVVAGSLLDALGGLNGQRKLTNLYLAPLATKPQAVGFGLFYLRNLVGDAASIIFPNCSSYHRETTKGVGRSWIYPIVI